VPVFVVTHNVPDGWSGDDAPFSFVADGVESAVAQAAAVAGDGIVGVAAADIVQHRLNARLLDEIVINLAVLLGSSEVWRCKLELWPRQRVSCLSAIFTVTAPRP
jgi:dihydrofolate reductase